LRPYESTAYSKGDDALLVIDLGAIAEDVLARLKEISE
jgi:hypothetical protein